MKYKFWPVVMAVLISLLPLLLVLAGSSTVWGKVKYSFAVVLLGGLIYYLGDRLD